MRNLLNSFFSYHKSLNSLYSVKNVRFCQHHFKQLDSLSFQRLFRVNFSCWSCHANYPSFNYFCPACKKLQKPSDVSYFDLFSVEHSFNINIEELTTKFRGIQSQLHPDKYSQKDKTEQDLSAEYSSLVNKAYSSLMDPLSRAEYMLHLKNMAVEEGNMTMDKEFLLEIMELNEKIDRAECNELSQFEEANKTSLSSLYQLFSKAFHAGDLTEALSVVAKIKYLARIGKRIKELKLKCIE